MLCEFMFRAGRHVRDELSGDNARSALEFFHGTVRPVGLDAKLRFSVEHEALKAHVPKLASCRPLRRGKEWDATCCLRFQLGKARS